MYLKRNSILLMSIVLFLIVLLLPACDHDPTTRVSPDSNPSRTEIPDIGKEIHFEVSNPLGMDRINEFFLISASFPDGYVDKSLLDRYRISEDVGNQSAEVISEYLDSSVSYWDSGSIQSVSFLLQDDFYASEIRSYTISFDHDDVYQPEPLLIEEMPAGGFGDFLRVNNGAYDFFIGHDLEPIDIEYNGLLPKDLYIRMEGDDSWTKTYALSHIYGNTPYYRQEFINSNLCEPIFVLSPGFPEKMDYFATGLTAMISLQYIGYVQELCPPFEKFKDPQQVDFYEAEVIISLYRDKPRIDISSTVVIREGFYNHSGFAIGGLETEIERPLVLFGDEDHTILQGAVWADTEELTDLPEFMQIEDGKFVFRRGGNRDAWGPFTILKEVSQFSDYYVVQGKNDRAGLLYFPDFQNLASLEKRNEGSEILPLNMIGAGPSIPLMVPNPIILSQTHLGGLGEVWVEINPGVYQYELIAIMDLPFGIDHREDYDHLVESLATPLILDHSEELTSRITLEIDSISNFNDLANSELIESQTSSMPSPATITPRPPVAETEKSIGDLWDFNIAGDSGGWGLSEWDINDIGVFSIEDGRMIIETTGIDPMVYCRNLRLDADRISQIEILMKVSAGEQAKLYFETEEGEMNENRSFTFDVHPGEEFVLYAIDTALNPYWKGIVTQLRIDPDDRPALVEIDYIQMIEYQ